MQANRKRGNGEGSISWRKDGRYEIAVVDPATGKRKRTYAKSESEAKRILKKMTTRADTGAPIIDSSKSVTAYFEIWQSDRLIKRRMESTAQQYIYRFRCYILPEIGNLKMSEVTMLHVEDLLDTLIAKGLKRGTVESVRISLGAMFSDAVRARHLAVNVVRLSRMPEATAQDRRVKNIPTDAQVKALMRTCKGTALDFPVTLCAMTGARIGEVLGMREGDLRLDDGQWQISTTISQTLDGGMIVSPRTKTGTVRTVRLNDEALDAIRRQLLATKKARLRAVHWEDHDLVFPTSIGTPQDSRNVRKHFKPLATAAGFPGSFHGLRHWFATLAMLHSSEMQVAEFLGHEKTSTTTDTYGHMRDDEARKIAVAVSVAVSGE